MDNCKYKLCDLFWGTMDQLEVIVGKKDQLPKLALIVMGGL